MAIHQTAMVTQCLYNLEASVKSYSSFYLLQNVRLIALRIKNVAEGLYNGNVKFKIYQSKVFFMVE